MIFSSFQPSQTNLNHMLCPAILDPFEGQYYRIGACFHQAALCPLLCKICCFVAVRRPVKNYDTICKTDEQDIDNDLVKQNNYNDELIITNNGSKVDALASALGQTTGAFDVSTPKINGSPVTVTSAATIATAETTTDIVNRKLNNNSSRTTHEPDIHVNEVIVGDTKSINKINKID